MSVKKFNRAIERGDAVQVFFNNTNGSFLCDLEDWERLKGLCWCLGKDGYPMCRLPDGKNIRFHQMIFKDCTGYVIDHISRDRLDNRKANLRIVSQSVNAKNKSLRLNNRSGCCGVSLEKQTGKWKAYLTINGTQITVGRYASRKEAVSARLRMAQEKGLHTAMDGNSE